MKFESFYLLVDGTSVNYFSAATDSTHLESFIQSIVSILEFFPFDSVDINWKYHGFEHGDEPLHVEAA
jgi:GH18 family chitinase